MLKDFLDHVSTNPQATVTWEIGGRLGTYTGKVIIVQKKSTNPQIGSYRDLVLAADGCLTHLAICSADRESPFSRAYTIRDDKIVLLGAA